MTVAPVVTETVYSLTGNAMGPFNTVWPYNMPGDVTVQLDDGDGTGPHLLTQGVDYVLTNNNPTLSNGGNVTLAAHTLTSAAWAPGALVALVRLTPRSQPSTFGEAVGFSPQASEQALDNVERQVQELTAAIGRAVLLEYGSGGGAGIVVPDEAKALWYNGATGALQLFPFGVPNEIVGTDAAGNLTLYPLNLAVTVNPATATLPNMAALQAAHITPGTQFVEIAGYFNAGDGGRSLYKPAAAGAGPGKVQDGLGNWWVLATQVGRNVLMFGAKGDGAADDSAAFTAAASFGPFSVIAGTTAGNFRVASSIGINVAVTMDGSARVQPANGVTVTFAGGFSAPNVKCFANAYAGQGTIAFSGVINRHGSPDWWGAQAGAPTFDCAPAISAAIVALPVSELGAGAYYIQTPIVLNTPNRTLRGVAGTQMPSIGGGISALVQTATQIVLTSPSATGIMVGPNQTTQPSPLLEGTVLEDLTVVRATAAAPLGVTGAAAIANPASGTLPCPTGIQYRWLVNAHFRRVFAIEHSIGHYIYGCVECYWDDCTSLRYTAGANTGNDNCSGFYYDYSAPLGELGGNASMYNNRCRFFSNVGNGLALTYCAALTTYLGFVDLFIQEFESGLTGYGIDLNGTGGNDYKGEDVWVRNCILDTNTIMGIRVQNEGNFAALTITGNYIAMQAPATSNAAVYLHNLGGPITLLGNQIINGTGAPNIVGLSVSAVASIHAQGDIMTNITQPVLLSNVQFFRVDENIHFAQPAPTTPREAHNVANCLRGSLTSAISGIANAYTCGYLVASSTTYCEFNLTRAETSTVTSAASKIIYNGANWGGGATFGTGNIVTGAGVTV